MEVFGLRTVIVIAVEVIIFKHFQTVLEVSSYKKIIIFIEKNVKKFLPKLERSSAIN